MELRIEGLNKRYGAIWATRDLSLTLTPGILGLLGPNGAGKSTLMRMVATVTRPTSGAILLDGTDVRKNPDVVRRTLGYLPQDFGIYPHLNAVEFLEYVAALKGLDRRSSRTRIDDLLEMLNLAHARSRPLGGFSGGMRQRVGIAQALLNDPRLLVVDEPTTGLDPEERLRFKRLLTDLSGERIVILSTHICSDVESIANRVAIVAAGQLLVDETPAAIVAKSGSLERRYLEAVGEQRAA
ncbi:MAG: ABC transporter ATP-binding protein [Candidatus Eremiobacteraeota bacterium]|nr:ABC transporter ATP-binding protein [Candidatus Eremiobacteraeota bacterium]